MNGTPAYLIKGDLSEKQIEADVASFMGWCTPPEQSAPFRLLDIDEQITGADKLFDRGVAIYMQFKKSQGLQPASIIKPSTRKNRSPLEAIREFRAEKHLDDDPTLFFALHKQAATADDLQHNVLLGYENPPYTRGIYVAPLILGKVAYHSALFRSTDRFLVDPFYYRLRHKLHAHRWVSWFGFVPFLREHVSIPPHEPVADHHHHYAYSATGTDISWHSPSIVSHDPSRLSDFLRRTLAECLDNSESMLSIKDLRKRVQGIAESVGFDRQSSAKRPDDMEFFQHHAKWLRETHGIRQFLLVTDSDTIARLRA